MHRTYRLALLGGSFLLAGCAVDSGSEAEAVDQMLSRDSVSPDTTEKTQHLLGSGYQLRFNLINMQATGPEDSILIMTGTVTKASDDRGCVQMELDADARLTQFGQPIEDDFTLEARPPGADDDADWTTYSAEVLNEDGIKCVLASKRLAP